LDNGEVQNLVLAEETFFFSIGSKEILVRIRIPTIDLRSDAYTWTQAWLTSLKIPIE
jgi:hypothetical protein